MKREVKTAAGPTVYVTVYAYQRKAQFTGVEETHTGIKSAKVEGAFNPIIDGVALVGSHHTNAYNITEI